MTLGTLLRLGRVSNLPTVWTNALAGSVLASANGLTDHGFLTVVLLSGLALTLFYECIVQPHPAFVEQCQRQPG